MIIYSYIIPIIYFVLIDLFNDYKLIYDNDDDSENDYDKNYEICEI